MREVLLEILSGAFQPSDVNATQQMGVQMSNAVREKGVVIIQNQNVEVYARIMPSMVKALRICDSISDSFVQVENTVGYAEHPPMQLSAELVADPIEECCQHLYERGTSWKDMQRIMESRYMKHVISQCATKAEAARFLKIGPTYLSKITTERGHVPDLSSPEE
jgi:hypothetical protein